MTKRNILRTLVFGSCVFIVVLLFVGGFCLAGEDNKDLQNKLDNTVNDQINKIDWSDIEFFIDENCDETLLSKNSVVKMLSDVLSGEYAFNAGNFLEYLSGIFLNDLNKLIPLLGGVAIVCVLSGLVDKTKSNLMDNETGNLINFYCYAAILLPVLSGVWQLYLLAKKTVKTVKTLTDITMPVLLTYMTAVGAATSVKVYNPAIALLSQGVTEIISDIVLPTFVFSVVINIISNMSNIVKLDKLSTFFKNLSKWVLGITFTVFTGFLAVQGLTAATIDGVSIRAAKFATRTYIPILGGYLADGFDLILASCVLVKNSFGIVAMTVLVAAILTPCITITVYNIALQLVCALVEPVADKRIVGFLGDTEKTVNILFVSVIAVAFMLLVLIMLIIFSANVI